MTREELKEYLPHREPMLLVDEITMDENNVAHGIYHVRGDEFFLQGHFPGQPVVPGVILCEIIAQSCALLLGDALKGKTPFYIGIDKVKFKHQVVPGDTAEITAYIEKQKGVFYFTHGELRVSGKLCVTGKFSFALIENSGK